MGISWFLCAFGALMGNPVTGALLGDTFVWRKAILWCGVSVLLVLPICQLAGVWLMMTQCLSCRSQALSPLYVWLLQGSFLRGRKCKICMEHHDAVLVPFADTDLCCKRLSLITLT
jgi:hypothetical protein